MYPIDVVCAGSTYVQGIRSINELRVDLYGQARMGMGNLYPDSPDEKHVPLSHRCLVRTIKFDILRGWYGYVRQNSGGMYCLSCACDINEAAENMQTMHGRQIL